MYKLKYVGDKSLLKENEKPCDFCIFKDEPFGKQCVEGCGPHKDGFCDYRFKDKD